MGGRECHEKQKNCSNDGDGVSYGHLRSLLFAISNNELGT